MKKYFYETLGVHNRSVYVIFFSRNGEIIFSIFLKKEHQNSGAKNDFRSNSYILASEDAYKNFK